MSSFDLAEWALDADIEVLKADGFDDCCIGVIERCGCPPILCYSTEKIIDQLVTEGMNHEDAREHFSFNISGAWMGELTPCFLEAL